MPSEFLTKAGEQFSGDRTVFFNIGVSTSGCPNEERGASSLVFVKKSAPRVKPAVRRMR